MTTRIQVEARAENVGIAVEFWEATVRDLGPSLLRYFRAAGLTDTEDLVQDVFVRLLAGLKSYDPKRGTIRMLAFGYARNLRFEGRRQHLKLLRHDQMSERLPATQKPQDSTEMLRRAVTKLSADEQDVILLLIDRDLTLVEISSILGMPLGTVKSHVSRAKQKLKSALQGEGHA